jgi:integrase
MGTTKTKKMTQTWVNDLGKLDATGKIQEFKDTICSGLRVVVSPKGKRIFQAYFSLNNQPEKHKLGDCKNTVTNVGMTLKEARIACDKMRNDGIEDGYVSRSGTSDEVHTLTDLWKLFEKYHSSKQELGTQRLYEGAWRLYVRDKLGYLPAHKITKKMVVKKSTEVTESKGHTCGNKVLMILNGIYNYCIAQDFYKGKNPAHGVPRDTPKERHRFLNEEERDIFFEAVAEKRKKDPEFASFLLLLIHTGQRSHNVISMRWSQLDFNTNKWAIPADEMKNKKTNVVTLTQSALDVIGEFNSDRKYVLHSNPDCENHLQRWQAKWRLMREKLVWGPMEEDPDNHVNLHDMRRTFGAIMAQKQYSLHSIANALGQSSISSTSIYAILNQAAMEDAFETVEDVLLKRGKKND